MAESAQIQKVSIKHDVLLDFLIANPTMKYGEVAVLFGVTRAWLSTIIHSHAFQERLKTRQDELFSVAVVRPIQEKLMGVAALATEKLMEVVEYESDARVLSQVADTALKNLGYGQKTIGPPAPSQAVNVTVNITKEELADARALIGKVSSVEALPTPVVEVTYLPSPEQTAGEP